MLSIIQIVLFSAVVIVENLTKTHALVMRHIYTKRMIHLKLMTVSNKVIVSVIMLTILIFLMYLVKKKEVKFPIVLLVLTALLISILFVPVFEDLLTYSYLAIITMVTVVIESIP